MVFVDTHTILLHWIWIEALKILGSTLLKFLYFYFGMGLELWDLLCGIPSEEGKGFYGLLENCVKPHNSIAVRNNLCGKYSF